MRAIIFFIFIFHTAIALCGELEDLKKAGLSVFSTETFSASVSVRAYQGKNDVKPAKTYSGTIHRDSKNFRTTMFGKTSLYNTQCSMLIDEQEKVIIYDKPVSDAKNKTPEILLPNSFYSNNYKYSYLINNSSRKRIAIVPKESSVYEKIEVEINPVNNMIVQIIYFFADISSNAQMFHKIQVDYTSVSLSAKIPGEVFSEKKYVQVNKGSLVASGNYAGYTVYDKTKNRKR
jgi:hypothetical protein